MRLLDYFDFYEARDVALFLMGELGEVYQKDAPQALDDQEHRDSDKAHSLWLADLNRALEQQLIPSLEGDASRSARTAIPNPKRLLQKLKLLDEGQRVELYLAAHKLFWTDFKREGSVADDLFDAGFFSERGHRFARLHENWDRRRKKWS